MPFRALHIPVFVGFTLLAACAEPKVPTATFETTSLPLSGPCVAVSTAEFGTSGAVSWLDTRTGDIHRAVTTTYHDTALRPAGDDIVVLNRLGADNLQWLDPGESMRTRQQLALPAGANPWDYVQRGDRAVVAGYGRGELFILQRADGQWSIASTLSLREWADTDGNAEPARLLLEGDTLLVLLQRLDGFACGENGALLALDWASLRPLEPFAGSATADLGMCNPTALARGAGNDVFVSAAGVFRAVAPAFGVPILDDGGLVRVDLSSGEVEQLFTESSVDADLLSVDVGPDGSLWVLLSDADARVAVHQLRDRQLPGTAVAEGDSIFDVDVHATHVWVADRAVNGAGVRAFAFDGAPLTEVVDVGLPPVELLPFECPR